MNAIGAVTGPSDSFRSPKLSYLALKTYFVDLKLNKTDLAATLAANHT